MSKVVGAPFAGVDGGLTNVAPAPHGAAQGGSADGVIDVWTCPSLTVTRTSKTSVSVMHPPRADRKREKYSMIKSLSLHIVTMVVDHYISGFRIHAVGNEVASKVQLV
jgi:hypothetical protein